MDIVEEIFVTLYDIERREWDWWIQEDLK
jgi:hypothetical protein